LQAGTERQWQSGADNNGGRSKQYVSLPPEQREALLASLDDMPRYLEDLVSALTPELTRRRAPDDLFSPVEQIWHLPRIAPRSKRGNDRCWPSG